MSIVIAYDGQYKPIPSSLQQVALPWLATTVAGHASNSSGNIAIGTYSGGSPGYVRLTPTSPNTASQLPVGGALVLGTGTAIDTVTILSVNVTGANVDISFSGTTTTTHNVSSQATCAGPISWPAAIPAFAAGVLLGTESSLIRFTDDGTTLSGSVGMPLYPMTQFMHVIDNSDLGKMSFYLPSGSASTQLTGLFYARKHNNIIPNPAS